MGRNKERRRRLIDEFLKKKGFIFKRGHEEAIV